MEKYPDRWYAVNLDDLTFTQADGIWLRSMGIDSFVVAV